MQPLTKTGQRDWIVFLTAIAVIAVLWLGVLPRVEQLPIVQHRIEFLERNQIDPAALFYTDLDCMDKIDAQLSEKVPDTF